MFVFAGSSARSDGASEHNRNLSGVIWSRSNFWTISFDAAIIALTRGYHAHYAYFFLHISFDGGKMAPSPNKIPRD